MQGGIAQTIGLVLAVNARLRGIALPRWPEGSAYVFCNEVRFEGRKDRRLFGLGRPLTIGDPNQWLETLPAGTQRAQLTLLPRNDPNISDRESVGFTGGGPVCLASIIGTEAESSYGGWEVTRENDPERRIWSVIYRNVPVAIPDIPTRSDGSVRDRLQAAIEDAAQFSDDHGMGFTETLQTARAALDGPDPLAGFYFADMIPEALMPLTWRQLFACAGKAWVFGGMGSWNDVWFEGEDQARYQALSDALFSAVIDTLAIATNASAPAR
ncbi:hypothetical protein OF829_13680 [Sphingomonas sp. LB-2]|uniref:hypothetical protein n=1 Tax=Sphingomonas caeni TaxID=2984949 RepID=UPI0022324608|nr:hypothetical protein [Sphingomonas caeni]MCW3848291.1 hypothetical protein [Sphingomonas caeni]